VGVSQTEKGLRGLKVLSGLSRDSGPTVSETFDEAKEFLWEI
jgi:hypothetical protein